MIDETRRPAGSRSAGRRVQHVIARIGTFNLIAAVILSALGIFLAVDPANGPGGLLSPLMMLAVTLPVLLAGCAPVLAAVLLAIGVLANEIVIGPMVRCGVVLPVLFVIIYQLGAATETLSRRDRVIGVLGCVAVALMELRWDPVLDDSAAILIIGLGGGFYVAGLLISSRNRLVRALRLRTAELGEQRFRTAEVEVAADRAKVGLDLEKLIRTQIRTIATAAERAGAAARAGTADSSRAAFAEAETSGRETLTRMREVVGTLRDAPTEPPPGLGQLAALIDRNSGTTLRLDGQTRPVSANVELSAYRIVEQLLVASRTHASAPIDVVVRFLPDTLEIRVSGRTDLDSAPLPGADSSMRSVRARAELHGGTVRTGVVAGRLDTVVRLPLPSAALR